MMVNSQAYAQMQCNLHGPDWRWQLALSRVATSFSTTDTGDRHLCDALNYLRERAGDAMPKAPAARKFPHVAAAERLARNDQECGYLKVLVLAGCSSAEISERFAVDLQVIATWENLFFDIRAMREKIIWILAKVISPIEERGDARLATKLKFAYVGGPIAARALLQECRLPLQHGAKLFDRKIALSLQFAEAAEIASETDRSNPKFTKRYLKLRQQAQLLQQAEEQLTQKCQKALDRLMRGRRITRRIKVIGRRPRKPRRLRTNLPGKRSTARQKINPVMEFLCVVLGYRMGPAGLKDLLLGADWEGMLRYIGTVESGLPGSNDLVPSLQARRRSKPLVPCPHVAYWVEPDWICNVRFHGWRSSGGWRDPVIAGGLQRRG